MKIYLSGQIAGSYRAQNIIKVLADNNIPFQMLPVDYYLFGINNKFLMVSLAAVFFVLTTPLRAILIAMASHVLVLPMNSSPLIVFEIFLAKVLRKRIVSDFYISAYDTVVNDRALVKSSSVKAWLKKIADKTIIRCSTDLIFLNNAEADYYLDVAKVRTVTARRNIIPICVDYKKELFSSHDSNIDKADKEFVVCWWGTYIPLHGLETIIEAFSYLRDRNIKLYVFGNSSDKAAPYVSLISKLDLGLSVVIRNDLTFANGELAPFLKENCDLALGNFGVSKKANTVLVNKVVDALSLGVPCLTMETEATTELLNSGEGVVFCDPSPQKLAEKIYELSSDRKHLVKIGKDGIAAYFDKFSPDAFKIKLLKLLMNE